MKCPGCGGYVMTGGRQNPDCAMSLGGTYDASGKKIATASGRSLTTCEGRWRTRDGAWRFCRFEPGHVGPCWDAYGVLPPAEVKDR